MNLNFENPTHQNPNRISLSKLYSFEISLKILDKYLMAWNKFGISLSCTIYQVKALLYIFLMLFYIFLDNVKYTKKR